MEEHGPRILSPNFLDLGFQLLRFDVRSFRAKLNKFFLKLMERRKELSVVGGRKVVEVGDEWDTVVEGPDTLEIIDDGLDDFIWEDIDIQYPKSFWPIEVELVGETVTKTLQLLRG